MIEWYFVYPLLGAVSGVLAGLLGIGGGLVIVPTLIFVFPLLDVATDYTAHAAVATSLATVLLTSLSSTWAHQRHNAVEWRLVRGLGIAMLVGACGGALLARELSSDVLRLCFAIFALSVAVQMGWQRYPRFQHRLPARPSLAAAGGMIGLISALVGIGGGTMTVPFLRWCQVPVRHAIATSAACGFPIALGGVLGFSLILSQQTPAFDAIQWSAALTIALVSVVTAPVGARWAHQLPTTLLVRLFAIVLALVGIRLLFN